MEEDPPALGEEDGFPAGGHWKGFRLSWARRRSFPLDKGGFAAGLGSNGGSEAEEVSVEVEG